MHSFMPIASKVLSGLLGRLCIACLAWLLFALSSHTEIAMAQMAPTAQLISMSSPQASLEACEKRVDVLQLPFLQKWAGPINTSPCYLAAFEGAGTLPMTAVPTSFVPNKPLVYCTYVIYPQSQGPDCPSLFVVAGAAQQPPTLSKNMGASGLKGMTPKSGACECAAENGSALVGDPINSAIGNKFAYEEDYSTPGSPRFGRYYNSRVFTNVGSMGRGWRHNYSASLSFIPPVGNPLLVFVHRPDGRAYQFVRINGVWTPDGDLNDKLSEVMNDDGDVTGYKLFVADEWQTEVYSTAGILQSVISPLGQVTTLAYSSSSTPKNIAPGQGFLIGVTGPNGRRLEIATGANGHVTKVTLPSGRAITFTYYSPGQEIASVTYPDASQKRYLYNETGLSQANPDLFELTGVIDEEGARYETTVYDANQRVTASYLSNEINRISLTYNDDGGTSIQYPLGATVKANFALVQGVQRISSISSSCGRDCGL